MSKANPTLATRLDAAMKARGYEHGKDALREPRVVRFVVKHYPEIAALARRQYSKVRRFNRSAAIAAERVALKELPKDLHPHVRRRELENRALKSPLAGSSRIGPLLVDRRGRAIA